MLLSSHYILFTEINEDCVVVKYIDLSQLELTSEEHCIFLNHFENNLLKMHASVTVESVAEDGLILKSLHSDQLELSYNLIKNYCQAYQKGKANVSNCEFSEDVIFPTRNPLFPLIFWFDGTFALKSENNLCIWVYNGDICTQLVDVIVNSTSFRTSEFIYTAAGQDVTNEINRIVKERGKPFNIGQMYVTDGGQLKARQIFHTPSLNKMPLSKDERYYQCALNTIANCLKQANKKLRANSIAFPDLSSGKQTKFNDK